MNITRGVIVAVFSVFTLSGCASGILRADQDRYTGDLAFSVLGSTSLLGPPNGDQLRPLGASGSITDNTPGGLGRAFRINDQLEFVARTHTVPDRYTVVWSGVHTNASSSAVTRIRLREESGEDALEIRYVAGTVEVIWGEDVGLAPTSLSANLPHQVNITIRNGAVARADVTVSVGDETILTRPNLELIDAGFERLEIFEIIAQSEYYIQDLIAVSVNN